jgi:hypothetical protein
MRYRLLACLLALLLPVGCGGDDDGNGAGGARTESAGTGGGELRFDQVRRFTVDYMRRNHDEKATRTDKKKVFCPNPKWLEDKAFKQQTADVHQAQSAEVLSCIKGDASVSYLQFEDAGAAQEAPATKQTTETATLVAGNTLVTALFAGASELAYIEALAKDCGCGKVIKPTPVS